MGLIAVRDWYDVVLSRMDKEVFHNMECFIQKKLLHKCIKMKIKQNIPNFDFECAYKIPHKI